MRQNGGQNGASGYPKPHELKKNERSKKHKKHNTAQIGSIDERWNWLEGWTSKNNDTKPYAVHFTRGGPWFDEWKDVEFSKEWHSEKEKYLNKKFNS